MADSAKGSIARSDAQKERLGSLMQQIEAIANYHFDKYANPRIYEEKSCRK